MIKNKNTNNNTDENMLKMNINWYPGHMAKTRKQIESDIKLVDIVIEILDSRVPISSQNPDIKKIIQNKKRIIVLNKADLSEEIENSRWVNYFKNNGIPAILCNSKSGQGIDKIEGIINSLMEEDKEKALQKGRINKIIRVMIVGIPNVGKSSLINRMSKKSNAEVGNKPGITKRKQWIRLSNNIELLDTPGVLWPKLDQENTSLNLAYTGTIKSEILEETEVAYNMMKFLLNNYKNKVLETYKIQEVAVEQILSNEILEENEKVVEVMNLIGKARGAIIKGGNIDLDRVSKMILDDFKNGRLGRITLEKVK